MSTYLGPPVLDSIPANALIVDMQNTIVGQLTTRGWQLVAQVAGDHSDLIPPASEAIGTSTFREVVRIYFPNNTTITIGSYQVCIADAFPQSIRLTAKTSGAVQAGVTINGVTVLGAVGSAASTANDNLQALYYALMDSTDPTITSWTFAYDGNGTLICTAKTPAAMVACSGNANVNYFAHAASVLAGARSGFANVDVNYGYSVTVDLTNGFVYYMDIWSRTFTLSTRCLSGTSGPVFASYIDHAEALAVIPDSPYCSPIELLIGDSSSSNPTASVRVTHWWTIPTEVSNRAIPAVETTSLMGVSETTREFHPWMGSALPRIPMDAPLNYTGYAGTSFSTLAPVSTFGKLGLATASSPLDTDYKVTPLAFLGATLSLIPNSGFQNAVRFLPAMNLEDVFKWTGTEPNETSSVCQVQPPPATYPTLAQALDATTAYSSILLSSTSGLPSQGTIIIGTEEITYTGISGSSVTGTTMGANGSPRARHFIGHTVSPASWFMKINNGAICCGPTKPV